MNFGVAPPAFDEFACTLSLFHRRIREIIIRPLSVSEFRLSRDFSPLLDRFTNTLVRKWMVDSLSFFSSSI